MAIRLLHTSLIALDAIPIEVQIQTKSMEDVAENGVAAHWAYKTGNQDENKTLGARKMVNKNR